jgi:hypothetical protein
MLGLIDVEQPHARGNQGRKDQAQLCLRKVMPPGRVGAYATTGDAAPH